MRCLVLFVLFNAPEIPNNSLVIVFEQFIVNSDIIVT